MRPVSSSYITRKRRVSAMSSVCCCAAAYEVEAERGACSTLPGDMYVHAAIQYSYC